MSQRYWVVLLDCFIRIKLHVQKVQFTYGIHGPIMCVSAIGVEYGDERCMLKAKYARGERAREGGIQKAFYRLKH